MIHNLRRLIWRYKIKLILKEKVRDSIQLAMDQLWLQYNKINRETDGMLYRSTLLQNMQDEFEVALNNSSTELKSDNFRGCLQHIETSGHLLEKINVAIDANRDIEEAIEAIKSVNKYAGGKFQTVKDCEFLLGRARDNFNTGHYRAAKFITSVCLDEVKRLTTCRKLTPEESNDFKKRMLRQRRLIEFAQKYSPSDGALAFASSALESISLALRDQKPVLVNSLLNDLEVDTDGQAFFYDVLEGQIGNISQIDHNKILLLLSQNGIIPIMTWRDSAERLLGKSLARLTLEIGETIKENNLEKK